MGKPITCAEDRAKAWHKFLKNKFAPTKRETMIRPAMKPLPPRDPDNTLTEKEVREAIKSLKNHKAVGNDGIPVEIYKKNK